LKNLRKGWAWWFIPVNSAIWEVELGGLWVKASLGKSLRPYLKNQRKAKDWWSESSGRVFT
jgi:hypothetical protein